MYTHLISDPKIHTRIDFGFWFDSFIYVRACQCDNGYIRSITDSSPHRRIQVHSALYWSPIQVLTEVDDDVPQLQ